MRYCGVVLYWNLMQECKLIVEKGGRRFYSFSAEENKKATRMVDGNVNERDFLFVSFSLPFHSSGGNFIRPMHARSKSGNPRISILSLRSKHKLRNILITIL